MDFKFLSDRVGRVCYSNVSSDELRYKFGLPQGSCLSPILFNVFLHDLFKGTNFGERCEASVFADDIRISCYDVDGRAAARRLSFILSRVGQWARKNRVRFSKDKCK